MSRRFLICLFHRSDVKGLVLTYCDTTRDFVHLSSVSRSWRHAASRSHRYAEVKKLERAFGAEPSVVKQLDVVRKRLKDRGRKAKCRNDRCSMIFVSFVWMYVLANVAAGVCGLWLFGIPRLEQCDSPARLAGCVYACDQLHNFCSLWMCVWLRARASVCVCVCVPC